MLLTDFFPAFSLRAEAAIINPGLSPMVGVAVSSGAGRTWMGNGGVGWRDQSVFGDGEMRPTGTVLVTIQYGLSIILVLCRRANWSSRVEGPVVAFGRRGC